MSSTITFIPERTANSRLHQDQLRRDQFLLYYGTEHGTEHAPSTSSSHHQSSSMEPSRPPSTSSPRWSRYTASSMTVGDYLSATHYELLLKEVAAFGVEPDTVMSDYEQALINAIKLTWPSSTKRTCFFHHKQSLCRNLTHHDLIPEYKVENTPVRKAFQMMGEIAFVPLGDVPGIWSDLKHILPSSMRSTASGRGYVRLPEPRSCTSRPP